MEAGVRQNEKADRRDMESEQECSAGILKQLRNGSDVGLFVALAPYKGRAESAVAVSCTSACSWFLLLVIETSVEEDRDFIEGRISLLVQCGLKLIPAGNKSAEKMCDSALLRSWPVDTTCTV
jgi:hypothetical protein